MSYPSILYNSLKTGMIIFLHIPFSETVTQSLKYKENGPIYAI